jgi:hypothetical protein
MELGWIPVFLKKNSSAGALQHFVGSVLAKLSKQNNDSMAEIT